LQSSPNKPTFTFINLITMSHGTGSFVSLAGTPFNIGAAFGAPNNVNFAHTAPPPAAGPTKFIILHFQNASFPGASRLEVNLGYATGETDVFDASSGTDFWTRPINTSALPGGNIPISFIPDGMGGGVQITGYGRGERHEEAVPNGHHDSFSNSDPFLVSGNYTEPQYDPFWFCHLPPHWDNVAAIPAADIRATVAKSAGMLVSVHGAHVSTCSCTLIGSDLVISAAHCIDHEHDIASMSVIFNYQTNADGSVPAVYQPVFHKVIALINHGPLSVSSPIDYMLLRIKIPPGGLGINPIPMRASRPAAGELVFGIHHPNGAVKKVSPSLADGFASVLPNPGSGHIPTQFDVTGGTSGSGLFDMAGRFLGVLSSGQGGPFAVLPADRHPECRIGYASSAEILNHLSAALPAAPARDVVIVFDKSGSMASITPTGLTKLQEAKNAAALFIQLIRAGGTDQAGLVTFSTSAASAFDLADVNNANKNTLIGAVAPFTGGIVGGITAGGNTSIGHGLSIARDQMNLRGLVGNRRTILLLTDGLQNTAPMVETISGSLINTDIFAVGYGAESGLNGTLLTQLAHQHNGRYMRAGDGLSLLKFFAITFGNIFEAGTLLDPDYILPAGRDHADPVSFTICEETTVTIIIGWERANTPLQFRVQTPAGTFISLGGHGIATSSGLTWRFARIELPQNGEQNGTWKVYVDRANQGGEFSVAAADARYFINILAKDGPLVVLQTQRRRYYTGETYNPAVAVATAKGFRAPNARVMLTITKPDAGAGNILSQGKFENITGEIDGDIIPARYLSLQKLEAKSKTPLIGFKEDLVEMTDDGRFGNGAMEPDGIFGIILKDLFKHEGNYTFRAVATYGEGCTGTRETTWSVHVEPGIDSGQTVMGTRIIRTLPDGKQDIRITLTPKDKYGNLVGPGRIDMLDLASLPGSVITSGGVTDNGDGTYGVTVQYDPASGSQPGVVIRQPDRDPVVAALPHLPPAPQHRHLGWWFWLMLLLILLLALAWWLK
jgi:von Willebrand factor type A domain/Trypsin-like peptidase domain